MQNPTRTPSPSAAAGPTSSGIAPVKEELALLDLVMRAVRMAPPTRVREDHRATLITLRESLAEERLPEDRASIVEQMETIRHLLRQLDNSRVQEADPANPYFGHLRIADEDGDERDICIGRSTYIRGTVRIVDWRDAPISRVFYQHREGDEYLMHIDGNEVEGEVLVRRTVTIDDSVLIRVGSEQGTWILDGTAWVDAAPPRLEGGEGVAHLPDMELGGAAPTMSRRARYDKHLPEIASLLDPAQFDLIASPDAGLVAIQGSAGSGKTTVALHRVAYLAFHDPARFAPAKTLVVVYSKALARYISRVLPSLGVDGVAVEPFEGWAADLVHKLFPRMPTTISEQTPAAVSRFKQHGGLLAVMEEAATAFPELGPVQLFDEILTSRTGLADAVARHMPGAFSDGEVESIFRWCASAHAARTTRREPDPDEDPEEVELPTLDAEDVPLLLRLHQLTVGPLTTARRGGRAIQHAHLVIDEAQDMSPIEITVLLGTVLPRHPVTLAGDVAQQLDHANDFQSWEYVLSHLRTDAVSIRPLEVSYRSTEPIMRAALAVLGHLAPAVPPRSVRAGEPVRYFEFGGAGQCSTFLADMLQDLMQREPHASLAIMTRHPAQADQIYAALDRAGVPMLRRVRDQDFEFLPGIEVVEMHETKGLEFDYVVLVDVDAESFPESDASRRLLHVGMTRAAHLCWIMSAGRRSPILPDWLEPVRAVG